MKRAILDALTPPAQAAMRFAATSSLARPALNRFYQGLDERKRDRFYWYFAKIFRDRKVKTQPAFWNLDFDGTPIRISLRPENLWLDWDTAVSALGRDLVTKQSYLNLIKSKNRPDIFLDIGSNYGVHSLLVACKGVRTIAFEPNADCNDRARQIHIENGVSVQIEQCALGDHTGEIKLWFSPADTWCGTTIQPSAAEKMTQVTVPLRTLDSYIDELRGKRILIKIDAEGAEKQVLSGAEKVLRECRPMIVFECWPSERKELWEFFHDHGYNLLPLPCRDEEDPVLTQAEFLKFDAENFIAIPRQ